jgi:hypothetical protein
MYFNRTVRGLFVAALVLSSVWTAAAAVETDFDAARYREHVKFLASDELEGRRPGTPGIEAAAEYIAKHFASAGLTPGGENGTWFQTLEVYDGKQLDPAAAAFAVQNLDHSTQVGEDWTPMPFTTMEDVSGPLAFAGYGIKAELYDYNDYADFDATGKVLLIFRYEPMSEDPEAAFGGKRLTSYSEFRNKAFTAFQREAKALLIVNPPLREMGGDGLYEWDQQFSKQTYDLPLVHITPALANALLKKAGMDDLETLQRKLDTERTPLSQDLGFDIDLKLGVSEAQLKTRNVLGLLKGNGNTNETLVIGAHYDHLGRTRLQWDRRDPDEYIHNGADDNASGSAAVIELARVLAKDPPMRRNILFMTFTAEEMGLLGSKHWVSNPTIPLQDVVAMLNMDMIGRLEQGKFRVYGVPSAAEFKGLVAEAAERLELEYESPRSLSGNSDHAAFLFNRIPYLFPFTGVHKDYHRPSDDWELIDAEGATRVMQLVHDVAVAVANMESGPAFQEGDDDAPVDPEAEQMKPAAEHAKAGGATTQPAAAAEGARQKRPPVRFGIIPDHSAAGKPGLVVDTVIDGAPAKAAGMQDGDRIIKIAEFSVKDIYGYMFALKKFNVGDKLDVVVVRDGKEVTLHVELAASNRPRPEN